MQTKTKITTVAALAALTVPAAAFGHGGGDGERGKSAEHASKTGQEQRSESRARGEARRRDGDDHRGKHKRWRHGKRAFVIGGVDATGVTVTDGKLAGPITLDPVLATRGAKKFLELTKTELRGEDTVTFGTAGDEVRIRYVGLESTDAIQPTDRVFVKGKLRRQEGSDTKTLDIKKIVVLRKGAERDDD
jgi:hypothetical protein